MNRFKPPRTHKSFLLCLLIQNCMLVLLFSLLSSTAWAGSMRCGTNLITDNKRPGPSKAKVRRVCGAPYSESGNRWVYYKGRSVYRLRFSETSGLVSINREIER